MPVGKPLPEPIPIMRYYPKFLKFTPEQLNGQDKYSHWKTKQSVQRLE